MSESDARVALITGASGGLGSAVVPAFLEEGIRVAGLSRQWRNRPGAVGFEAVEGDLSTREGAEAVVEETVKRMGRLDMLIHLAGGWAGGAVLEKTEADVWDQMLSMNLMSAVHAMSAVVAVMKKAGGGCVVAVGSRAGVEAAPGMAAYAASKAALHAVVRAVAEEVKDDGITVNAVLPGTLDTAANRKAMPKADHGAWVSPAAISSLLLWLCSEQGREVNGALIPIYGRS